MEVLYSSEKGDRRLLQGDEEEVGAWEVNSTSYRLIAPKEATVQYYPALFPNRSKHDNSPAFMLRGGRRAREVLLQ